MHIHLPAPLRRCRSSEEIWQSSCGIAPTTPTHLINSPHYSQPNKHIGIPRVVGLSLSSTTREPITMENQRCLQHALPVTMNSESLVGLMLNGARYSRRLQNPGNQQQQQPPSPSLLPPPPPPRHGTIPEQGQLRRSLQDVLLAASSMSLLMDDDEDEDLATSSALIPQQQ